MDTSNINTNNKKRSNNRNRKNKSNGSNTGSCPTGPTKDVLIAGNENSTPLHPVPTAISSGPIIEKKCSSVLSSIMTDRVNSIEYATKEKTFNKTIVPEACTQDDRNGVANTQDSVMAFNDNSKGFQIKSSTDGPFKPNGDSVLGTSMPQAVPVSVQFEADQEFSTGFCNSSTIDENKKAMRCEDFTGYPVQEATKIGTKIVSSPDEIPTASDTIRSIADKSSWSDAHISDDMNEKPYQSSTCPSSSIMATLISMICLVVKEVSTMLLGKATVSTLEANMAPIPVEGGSGAWVGWILGTFIGAWTLMIAKCVEVLAYILMTPYRVVTSIHINIIKLIVKVLSITPGGVQMLKALNGYVPKECRT